MIKFFKTQDILVTRFSLSKRKNFNNVLNDLLCGTDGSDNDLFPIELSFSSCDNNKSGSCEPDLISNIYLAQSQFAESSQIDFDVGKYINSSSVFYASGSKNWNNLTNPMNVDGTYKRQVYNTVKKMYYNDYNNSYNIFGFDDYDTTKTVLNLSNDFCVYSLSVKQAGDSIKPNSVIIYNQSGDLAVNIFDDGNHNLILSGTYFINNYEFSTNNTNTIQNPGVYGLGHYLYNT